MLLIKRRYPWASSVTMFKSINTFAQSYHNGYTKMLILIIQVYIVPSVVENRPLVGEKKIFQFPVCIQFLLEKYLALHLKKNLNLPNTKMLRAKFVLNWLSGSVEEEFIFRKYIFAISNYSPLEKGVALHLNSFECPTHKDALK